MMSKNWKDNYKVMKENRDFGKCTKWYMHKNLPEVEAENPRQILGKYSHPAGFFVFRRCWNYDPMRDFQPGHETLNAVAGPFASQVAAEEWAAAQS